MCRKLRELLAPLRETHTSSFDIDEPAALVRRRRERVIGTHWYNPPQIVPCVEVIPAGVTSAETLEATVAFLRGAWE